jgi:hypothetical protein
MDLLFFIRTTIGNGSITDKSFLVFTVINDPVFLFFLISENVFAPAPSTGKK